VKVFSTDPALTWLFCMTHPDDEISICAWIHRLAANGNRVYMSWTHSNPIREHEARKVAKLLSVPDDHLFFFQATDGSVCDEVPALLPRFRQMIESIRPDRVCCGAFEQGHLDHDATNYLVAHSFDGPVFEIPFYHTYLTRIQKINRFSFPDGEEVHYLNLQEQLLKKRVARQYPSQNIWSVLLSYEVWQRARLKPIELAKSERMRLQSHRDFRKPNHPPRLAYRIRRCKSWRRWRKALRAAMRADAHRPSRS
jgi:LmbE family N-acetylglucosaminyl deacetylase